MQQLGRFPFTFASPHLQEARLQDPSLIASSSSGRSNTPLPCRSLGPSGKTSDPCGYRLTCNAASGLRRLSSRSRVQFMPCLAPDYPKKQQPLTPRIRKSASTSGVSSDDFMLNHFLPAVSVLYTGRAGSSSVSIRTNVKLPYAQVCFFNSFDPVLRQINCRQSELLLVLRFENGTFHQLAAITIVRRQARLHL